MWKMYFSNDKRGISLVEALISIAILSLVMIGILTTLAQTVDISKRIDLEYTAATIAKSRIERARSVLDTSGFSMLADFGETDTVVNSEGTPDLAGYYRRNTTIASNYNGDANLAQVDVTVEYKYAGSWREDAAVSLTTVLSNIE